MLVPFPGLFLLSTSPLEIGLFSHFTLYTPCTGLLSVSIPFEFYTVQNHTTDLSLCLGRTNSLFGSAQVNAHDGREPPSTPEQRSWSAAFKASTRACGRARAASL